MKILDKIQMKDKEYMCTQIILFNKLKVYRVHELIGDEELFLIEEGKNYQVITEEKTLKEIYEFVEVKKINLF